jgi:hypothetical protein
MEVEVVRRGGLAGMAVRGVVDTAALPPAEAAAAEAALRGLPFDRPPAPPRHPDSFQYQISVEDNGARRSVVLDETELPEALRPVVAAAIRGGQIG